MSKIGKKWKVRLIAVVSLALMIATIPFAIWVTHTATAEQGNEIARCQSVAQPIHVVTIRGGKVSPVKTEAKECDTLTITNEDNITRLMAFGPHDAHISYDGVSERALDQGQSLSVKLIKTGTFTFHDHSDDLVKGSFTVSN